MTKNTNNNLSHDISTALAEVLNDVKKTASLKMRKVNIDDISYFKNLIKIAIFYYLIKIS